MLADLLALIFVLIGMSVVTVAASVLLVIKFGHPDDKNEALFPKFVVIYGLFLTASIVFMFPLDAAAADAPELRPVLTRIWYALFANIGLLLLVVLPLSISLYEDSDGYDVRSKFWSILYGLFPLLVVGIVAACLYPFFGNYTVPSDASVKATSFSAEMTINFLLFAIAIISVLGWAAFIIFVPIGLITLPMDLINAFITRPKPMSVTDYSREKLEIGKRATKLLTLVKHEQTHREEAGRRRTKPTSAERKATAAMGIEIYELKKRRAFLEEAYTLRGGNPLWYLFQLIVGVVFMFMTASWIIHVTIFVLSGTSSGLNTILSALQGPGGNKFPLGSILYFSAHSLYLLAAAVKGAFRFSFGSGALSIYPMEVGNTLMNAFLVNTWLILSIVFPLIQFCAIAFAQYAQGTIIEAMILNRVNNLPLFKNFLFFNNIYIYVMAAILFLSLVVTLFCPRNTTKQISQKLQALVESRV